jgi:tagatose-1,6-bisphosphate aldolase non-catalytic subunit AgaZ/GatZ
MCNDVYENPTVIPLDPSDYPYSQVADDIARALNPGSTIEDAVNHLVDLLESNDTREKLINEQLPLLVQRISKRGLKNCYKEIAENAVNRNRQRVRNND